MVTSDQLLLEAQSRRLSYKVGPKPVLQAFGEELRPVKVGGYNHWGMRGGSTCGLTRAGH